MNYFIENKDMEIILDALELLHQTMKNRESLGLSNSSNYSIDDVDALFQAFDNSGVDK